MRLANAFLAALILLAGIAGTAAAQQVSDETGTFYSHIYYDMGTGALYTPKNGHATELAGDVYNNTNPQAPAISGFSSTDLASVFGDRVTTTGTGILQENDFTIFNSGSSAGTLATVAFNIALFDGTTSANLASYFTAPITLNLPAGFFTIITITGLSALNANINTTDVVITQQVRSKTGAANRLGVAFLDPPTIGSSTNTFYISNSTTPAGFYNVGNPPINANPGYRINVTQPVPTHPTTWGSIKANYKN